MKEVYKEVASSRRVELKRVELNHLSEWRRQQYRLLGQYRHSGSDLQQLCHAS